MGFFFLGGRIENIGYYETPMKGIIMNWNLKSSAEILVQNAKDEEIALNKEAEKARKAEKWHAITRVVTGVAFAVGVVGSAIVVNSILTSNTNEDQSTED
jgi:hypothetical protein